VSETYYSAFDHPTYGPAVFGPHSREPICSFKTMNEAVVVAHQFHRIYAQLVSARLVVKAAKKFQAAYGIDQQATRERVQLFAALDKKARGEA
jgi:hypothetical protein